LFIQSTQSSRQTNQQTDKPTDQPTNQRIIQQITEENQSIQRINPTDKLTELNKIAQYGLKTQNNKISSGNEGVPTDRQTNQQTDRQTLNTPNIVDNSYFGRTQRVSQILSSLDEIKQEVRLKFKRLTNQEMLVFSAIYRLEEQGIIADYPLLAQKLTLSESSIRDYTQKIIKKGIPILKTKENNKKVCLSISKDLKKIATLSTIMQLRGI